MTSNANASISVIAASLTMMSHSLMHATHLERRAVAPRPACAASLIRTDVSDHAERDGDAEEQQDHGHDEHERCGEAALAVNQTLVFHAGAHPAQAQHEPDVVDDPEDQHADTEQHQGLAEIACR